MEIIEIGIDDRYVSRAIEIYTVVGFILRVAMQPGAIDHDVIDGTFACEQPVRSRHASDTSNFQSDEAVEVSTVGKLDGPVGLLVVLHFCHHVLGIRTAILRPSHQRSNSSVTGRDALPFGRQSAIRRTGADDDPMIIIAALGRYHELAGESCARL